MVNNRWSKNLFTYFDNKKNIVIQELRLEELGIDDEMLPSILEFLSRNPDVTSLKLRKNKIHEKGAKLLAKNITLYSLDLAWNHIRSDGAVFLVSGNNTLQELNLSGNHLDNEGAKQLTGALVNNSSLKSLILNFNGIESDGAFAIATTKNTSLFYVEIIKGNPMSFESEAAINEMTSRNYKAFKKSEAPIKWISWLFSQGKRTSSPHLLFSLPNEILVKIASHVSNYLPPDKAEKIAKDNFGYPEQLTLQKTM